MLDETLGKLNFWLMLIGFNLTFFPMHILGLAGHAAPHVHATRRGMGWDTLEPDRDDRRVHHRAVGAACSSST